MLVIAFENYLIKKGRQQVTVDRHLQNLRVLNSQISWNLESVDNFIIGLKKAGRSHATLNNYIDTIRLYAQHKGLDESLKNYHHFKKQYKIKGTLSDEEIERLLNLPPPYMARKDVWAKDTLFLKCLAYTGARPGEIAKLTKSDITDKYFQINETKTGRPRLIPIAEPLKDELIAYCSKCKTNNLFMTHKNKVYSDSNWLHLFHKRLEMIGVDRPNVTLYSLRHSMVTCLLRQKVASQTIAKLCGNSVEMINNTYSHMVLDDVEDALASHPLIRKQSNPHELIKELKRTVDKLNLKDDPRFEFILRETEGGIEVSVGVKISQS